MYKFLLATIIVLITSSVSYAGCGRLRLRREVSCVNDCHFDYNQVQLLIVQPQVQYVVEPEVATDKVERVVEVKEVERLRVVRRNKLAQLVQKVLVPVVVENYHY